jgi:hypothetical protein
MSDRYRVVIRDVNEVAQGQLTGEMEADFIPRWNGVGSWRIKCMLDQPGAELFTPGCGISVNRLDDDGNDVRIFSGQMTSYQHSWGNQTGDTERGGDSGSGTIEVAGVEDTAILGYRMVFPDPARGVDLQTTAVNRVKTGFAETVMRDFARENIGDKVPSTGPPGDPTRRVTNLEFSTDQARGTSITVSARFDNLLDLTQRIASPQLLGFSVKSVPNGYLYDVTSAQDLSLDVKFSRDLGNLRGYSYSTTAPMLTNAAVAGGGDGTARVINKYTQAVGPWGWMIEQFIDRRDTSVAAEMLQAAQEAFSQYGEQFTLSFNPIDSEFMRFGRDYKLGDKVTVSINGVDFVDTITQVQYELRPGQERIKPVIGSAESVFGKALDLYRVVKLIVARVGLLERRK